MRTIGDLADAAPDVVIRRFGKHGASLATRARGIDDDPVHRAIRRNRSGTSTRSMPTRRDPEVIERTLLGMADGVAGRLRSAGVRASTIAVKIRDSSFRTITRQRTLAEPTDLTEPIFRAALELARPEVRGLRMRLLGVTASNLGEREQLGAVPDRRPASAGGDRSGRRAAPTLRRAGRDPGRLVGARAAGAVRARPAEPPRPAGAWRTGRDRSGGRRRGRGRCCDS